LVAGESYPIWLSEPEDLELFWEMLHEAAHHPPLSDPAISRYSKAGGDRGIIPPLRLLIPTMGAG